VGHKAFTHSLAVATNFTEDDDVHGDIELFMLLPPDAVR